MPPLLALDDGLLVDSLADIAANKLTTILSRSEIRDDVDLWAISKGGVDLVALLPQANRKDGGLSAATVAFVLSHVRVLELSASYRSIVSPEVLQQLVDGLRRQLAIEAFPRSPRGLSPLSGNEPLPLVGSCPPTKRRFGVGAVFPQSV